MSEENPAARHYKRRIRIRLPGGGAGEPGLLVVLITKALLHVADWGLTVHQAELRDGELDLVLNCRGAFLDDATWMARIREVEKSLAGASPPEAQP